MCFVLHFFHSTKTYESKCRLNMLVFTVKSSVSLNTLFAFFFVSLYMFYILFTYTIVSPFCFKFLHNTFYITPLYAFPKSVRIITKFFFSLYFSVNCFWQNIGSITGINPNWFFDYYFFSERRTFTVLLMTFIFL